MKINQVLTEQLVREMDYEEYDYHYEQAHTDATYKFLEKYGVHVVDLAEELGISQNALHDYRSEIDDIYYRYVSHDKIDDFKHEVENSPHTGFLRAMKEFSRTENQIFHEHPEWKEKIEDYASAAASYMTHQTDEKPKLTELDRSDLELVRQVDREKQAKADHTRTRDEFRQKMRSKEGQSLQSGDRVYSKKNDKMYVVKRVTQDGVLFKGADRPIKIRTKDTGRKTDLGHRVFITV